MAADSHKRRAALVTGASQGLGAAIAVRLARDGYDVAVTSRNVDALADVMRDLHAQGARAVPIALDLRSQETIEQAVESAAAALPSLELLVNNAAVTLRRTALEVTPDEWRSVMDVNLTGTFFISQQMARQLVKHERRGAIVNLSSTHGVAALMERSTYAISKAGIIHMTRVLAYEWAKQGIRVNAVAPGTVDTPTRAAYFDANPGSREMMLARVPTGRFSTTEEVAAAVAYLASDAAANITGHTLFLDGGLLTY